MTEFDKKIATEAEFFEIIKPFDDVPSELSNGICLRKDKIPKYTEKTFDALNSYKHNQLVPLATFIDVGNADYVLFSFEWKKDGDLDCIVKPKNFNEEYPGIGFGAPKPGLSYGISYDNSNNELKKLIQWSGDSTSPGGEYFLIDIKKLKEYKKNHKLTINYFDFDVYTLWYRTNNVDQTITMKIESIIADDVQRVEKERFTFINEKITKTFSYEFSTNIIKKSLDEVGNYFFYDLVKRIRCYGSFAAILNINFPKIKSVTSKNIVPKIMKNGLDVSPLTYNEDYYIYNVTQHDNIKITLYPYGFEKIVTYPDGHEQTLFEYLKIRDIGNINKPTSDILTCTYNIANNGSEMTIDINVNNINQEQSISFDFLGPHINIYLYPGNPI